MEPKQEIQKQIGQQVAKSSQKDLTAVIHSGDKANVSLYLRDFKTKNGLVKYESVFAIPSDKRLTKMAEADFKGTIMLVVASIHMAFESMNLKRPMTADQELDLAEAIIDTSSEDFLALEDLLLFLQRLTRGEYGSLYESMDIPKFMDMFERYREERHQNLVRIREEKQSQYKVTGDNGRNSRVDQLSEHFSSMAGSLSSMKGELKELRKENNNLKKNIPDV